MEYKLEYLADDERKVFYLAKDTVIIGKLPENDIELKDNTVSRQHCRLQRSGKGYKLSDMNSTNGCYVNGRRVQSKALEVGDKITIGRTILSFLAVDKKESYRDTDDQKISLMVPLEDLLPVEKKPKLKSGELNFLASLTALGKSLIASQNIDESFHKLGDLIFQFVHPEKIFIFYYDEKQNDVRLKYTYSMQGQPEDIVNISKTIALKAIHEKVAILSSNTRNDSRFDSSNSVIMYGITSAISVPIWTKECIYGLIYVDTSSFSQVFGEKDLEIMSIIANFAGFAIEGANSLEKLNHERRLRARLERYHSPAVVSRLMEFQDNNTGELMPYRESEATVLFMDIVKFTSRAEKMTPIAVGMFLNNFFSEMTEIIFQPQRHPGQVHRRRHHGRLRRPPGMQRPRRARHRRRPGDDGKAGRAQPPDRGREADLRPHRHPFRQADLRGLRLAQAPGVHRAGQHGQHRLAPGVGGGRLRRDHRVRADLAGDPGALRFRPAGRKEIDGHHPSR